MCDLKHFVTESDRLSEMTSLEENHLTTEA